MDPLEKPANWPTIEPAINLDPGTLYLDSPYNKIITSLLEALAKDAYDAFLLDKNIVPTEKKRTQGKVALISDKDVTMTRKKKSAPKEKKKTYNKNSFYG